MKVKEKLLRQLLDDYVMSAAEFARKISVNVSEVEKMLNGEKVGVTTAKKFIAYIGPVTAKRLIDQSDQTDNPLRKNSGDSDL